MEIALENFEGAGIQHINLKTSVVVDTILSPLGCYLRGRRGKVESCLIT